MAGGAATLDTMRDFDALTGRGQLGRLRRLGRQALARYPGNLDQAALSVLRHEQNATFRVDARAGRFVLRISRAGPHSLESVGSETAWLAALRRDTGLLVPEPLAAAHGALVVAEEHAGVPGERLCVVLHWIDGRFVDQGLTPAHLGRLGELFAALHDHSEAWTPPPGFVRPRVDTLTTAAKRASFATPDLASAADPSPTDEDADRATALVAEILSDADARAVERAFAVVRATTGTLGRRGEPFGLIHADLHQENALHAPGRAGAIDFDDCGWGFHLYDLAVPLSELTARPGYRGLRAGLLDAYAARRPLPADADAHIDAFVVLRGLQLLCWVLESRDHAAFRDDWQPWARKELRWLTTLVDGLAGG
jgi:Ser/Thr protein kinase RdoA (MazF antagonist)